MQIDLGGAVAGAATAISVLNEYIQELYRQSYLRANPDDAEANNLLRESRRT